jgi:hypothetical protein
MAAGLARLGAAMDVNETVPGIDATEAAADMPMALEAAQPATSELTDMAPSGNRGALARNLMAWRREEEVSLDMMLRAGGEGALG